MHVMFHRVGDNKEPRSYSSFCVVPALGFKSILKLPISIDHYPIVHNSPLHWVHQLLKKNTMTMLWALGSALCDFGNKRVFVMYGPGGLGKSAVVKIFSSVLGNQTYEMPAHYASYKPKSLNNNTLTSRVLLYAACSQMVTVPDFEVLEDEDLNYKVLKVLTGDDIMHGVSLCNSCFSH
jgi:hypothetical protein